MRLIHKIAVVGLVAVAVPLAAQVNTTTVIMGRVVVRDGGAPLPYSSVTINGKNAQFTDSTGRFQVEGIAAGDIALRAKHVGFSPGEQTVRISRGDTVRVTLQLARLAIQLPATQSTPQACRDPGAPGRKADPALIQLYEQLQQNADHFRLLSQAYPYVLLSERQFVTTLRDSVTERTPMTTLTGASDRSWNYEPGELVFDNRTTTITSTHLPTLANFADEKFAGAHCFAYGGVVDMDGTPLIRVDFTVDERIKGPDVSGSIYLDPKTYQIRRSEVAVTKVPAAWRGQVLGLTVTSFFTEVVPGIPIVGAFKSEVVRAQGEVVSELQRVVEVQFRGAKP